MKEWVPIHVQTYAGYRGEEWPRAFSCGEDEHLVSRVLWQTDEQTIDRQRRRRFHVRTSGGEEYTLVQDVETSRWYLALEA